jgi:3-isopropylmalate/(R)-2-methylmalate dehydratase small subunit
MTTIHGRVREIGAHVSTDEILPGRYMSATDPTVLAAHAFEGLDPALREKLNPGDILVTGENFGTGSSREAAPRALQAAGFAAIVAESFARIFFRNCINIGLPVFWLPDARRHFHDGEMIEIDATSGVIRNTSSGAEAGSQPLPDFIQALVEHGGLIEYAKTRIGQSLVFSEPRHSPR